MKRTTAVAMIVFLLLFPAAAFADANPPPVPDSSIQSPNWANYIPAKGSGISGAAILQDNPTNQSLTREWVHEGGYVPVTKQVAVPKTVWVQSQEWVPPKTHQEWVPPVTRQVWVPEKGHWETRQVWHDGYWSTESVWVPGHWEYETWWVPGMWYHPGGWYYTDTPEGDPSAYYVPGHWQTTGYWIEGHWETQQVWHPGYYTTEQVWVVDQPGHWETVVVQPGYWKTVVDQPGYWKDTSHWETTVTYETVQDVQYTDSPHWTDYEKIIQQYQLKD
ncbi:hypothetical protein M2349_000309 [Caldanaerobacter subterraneus subsp. tengcongensis MB4]|uniref:YXWGXW repeat-containing protein n=1 Tax=Caldanaerobacter subterraneus subsp. tengcongensis (strain DSM 15242 / JCM 11007 / NBRC 100824 / MB4) TaxID=273068 RepID=Q8R8E3_CALS4|nr:YXWGXW repeat-containing protein [Caldanaerobacter subterraneus]AAM25235.1 hypothetical protein TTE2061 [Caldanaerobacter subterraneus subsp. tengcongensis MB4]MCS3915168.1 hypothetical protein [Caldanaerobacter subterraneus subsp. tengcongensis MB4]